MGETNFKFRNCSVIIFSDGKQIQIENATINAITVNENYPPMDIENKYILTSNYSVDITINRITKKRFIKLLMARGIQRNGAIEVAKYILKKYGYYSQTFLLLF